MWMHTSELMTMDESKSFTYPLVLIRGFRFGDFDPASVLYPKDISVGQNFIGKNLLARNRYFAAYQHLPSTPVDDDLRFGIGEVDREPLPYQVLRRWFIHGRL